MPRFVALLATAALMLVAPATAQERVKVGVLKLTSSAPVFVGVDKGFFREHGVEPELVFFEAAAPIATALAAGQIEVGATGLTAALYSIVLGGQKLWIVADKGRDGARLSAERHRRSEGALRWRAQDLVQQDGRPRPGVHYDEVVAITAQYTGAKPEIIKLGFAFQDRNGRLLVPDIDTQMTWWVKQGFLKSAIPLRDIVDTAFVEAAVKELRE